MVNRYIGIEGGYLGDFSYRTHRVFYLEFCDLDINPDEIDGTTRHRFTTILERSDPRTQATILEGILEKYPAGSSDLRTQPHYDKIKQMVARCRAEAIVDTPALKITSRVVEQAIADAQILISSSGPTSAVDRVHTALHGYLKEACDSCSASYDNNASITSLFKTLKQTHRNLNNLGPHQTPIVQVLKSLGSVLDALNPARNLGSVAHPNKDLLEPHEAALFINAARTILQYLDAKLEL